MITRLFSLCFTLNYILTWRQATSRCIDLIAVGEQLNYHRVFIIRQTMWDTKSDQFSWNWIRWQPKTYRLRLAALTLNMCYILQNQVGAEREQFVNCLRGKTAAWRKATYRNVFSCVRNVCWSVLTQWRPT